MIEKNDLQKLAEIIDEKLPVGYGFCLLTFPFYKEEDERLQYVSNGRREDIVEAMEEWIEKVKNDNFGKDV